MLRFPFDLPSFMRARLYKRVPVRRSVFRGWKVLAMSGYSDWIAR